MRKLIQKAVKVLAFLLVLALCYGLMDQVLKIKTDDMVSMVKLRQLPPDTVDVLLVGSSHIGTNVDNQQIFDEYGISSYNLWVGMQPIWNTYYCLKEALSAQSPQIVIAEVYLSTTTMDYSPKETAIKNVELLNLGINKVQAAFASYEKWTDAVEALWGLPYYHERYDDLTIADFVQENDLSLPAPRRPEGGVAILKMLDYASITDKLPITEKNEQYLRKIIDLCKQKNITLILMAAPFEATEEAAMRLNTVAEIAKEEGVPFLNYVKEWDSLGMDANTDF